MVESALSRELQTLKDSLIKDLLISGVEDSGLKTRVLREEDLTLDKAVKSQEEGL